MKRKLVWLCEEDIDNNESGGGQMAVDESTASKEEDVAGGGEQCSGVGVRINDRPIETSESNATTPPHAAICIPTRAVYRVVAPSIIELTDETDDPGSSVASMQVVAWQPTPCGM